MSNVLPRNAIAACKRLIELLHENNANSAQFISNDWRVRAIVWWLMVQITDKQLGDVSMGDLWSEIDELRKSHEQKSERDGI